ncbi:MAG: vanadium-dependent haloperoxidase [Gemmatimonadetes bacterium]|nr:vanadium-dependent haloperoxidase [Gemmatimonadota bacterium]
MLRSTRARFLVRAASPALILLAGCRGDAPATDPQLVAQWTRSSLAWVRSERLGPPVAARISAYASLALFEGYAADPTSGLRSLAGQLNGLTALPIASDDAPVDGAVVAAVAERVVLDSLFRDGFATTRTTIDSLAAAQVAARVAAGVDESRRARSETHGKALAAAILAWAAEDGFFATRALTWVPPKRRDQWENTATLDQFVPQTLSGQSDFVSTANPNVRLDAADATEKGVFTNRPKAAGPTTLPSFNPTRPTEPYWGTLRTFVIKDGDECAPPAPPAYSEKPGTPFYAMAHAFYDTVKALTPEQREIALFWADNPVATGTPGFHWISVVNQMIERRGLTAPEAAELYALTSLAIADAFIGCWKEKYRSMVVRPVAYVQRVFDPAYRTVIPTPPFPEYTSGHSVQSAAAVDVLIATLGDTIAFADSSQVDVGQPARHFASFTAARDEVAWSRVYAGVHYLPAVLDGVVQGQCIGKRVLALRTRSQE